MVNIELKRMSTEDEIKKQLIKNKYYLHFLSKPIFNFTYVSEGNLLYQLIEDRLEMASFDMLIDKIQQQDINDIENINALFDPSCYLVSPFNSTERFLSGQYFFTQQQTEFKNELMAFINMPNEVKFSAITGESGTGKTLLLYDIVKEIRHEKRSLIIHCGRLNQGQWGLKNDHDWNILSIDEINNIDVNGFDVIFIDEAQRIYINQLNAFIERINQLSCKAIFSYDKKQTLGNDECGETREQIFQDICELPIRRLTKNIRTNKKVMPFIHSLFDFTNTNPGEYANAVTVEHYTDIDEMKRSIGNLRDNDWTVLEFTPKKGRVNDYDDYATNGFFTSHRAIGQEYDKVAVIIDNHFNYDGRGKLNYNGRSYYNAVKMLFQNMTRTRNQLKILILNNSTIRERCLTLLNSLRSQ
ncbi:DNA/RNA helicase domain-containing protein [Providencia manganoxydans]|uniref:DNA/RNA helicase domain-containing protein n=1 Tax=Providencia manganoxydans TaxID=2923283 RepID=UPI0034E44B39